MWSLQKILAAGVIGASVVVSWLGSAQALIVGGNRDDGVVCLLSDDCSAENDIVVGAPGDMHVSLNFDVPPTEAMLRQAEEQMRRASVLLCDATDGAVRIRNVHWTTGLKSAQEADVWWRLQWGRAFATAAPGFDRGGRMVLFGPPGDPRSSMRGDVIAHEFGHLLLGLADSYAEYSSVAVRGPGFDGRLVSGTQLTRRGDDLLVRQQVGPQSEQAHSIMQQAGGQECVNIGTGETTRTADPVRGRFRFCLGAADCPVNMNCPDEPPLMSELSSPLASYDSLRGDGSSECPSAKETSFLLVGGRVDMMDNPLCGVDGDGDGNVLDSSFGEECEGGMTTDCPFHTGGTANCQSCRFDFSGCPKPSTCGNGQLDLLEECDGALLGANSCSSRGFPLGDLSCNSNCTVNTARCRARDSRVPPVIGGMGFGAQMDVEVRDSSTDNENAWHTLRADWIAHSDTHGTLSFSIDRSAFGKEGWHRLAVWDLELTTAGNVISIDGNAYDPNELPRLRFGGTSTLSDYMQPISSGPPIVSDPRKEAVSTPAFVSGAGPMIIPVELDALLEVPGGDAQPFVTSWNRRLPGSGILVPEHDEFSDEGYCAMAYNPMTMRFEATSESQRQYERNLAMGEQPAEAAEGLRDEWAEMREVLGGYGVEIGDNQAPSEDSLPNAAPATRCSTDQNGNPWMPEFRPSVADYLNGGQPQLMIFALDASGTMGAPMPGLLTGTRMDFMKTGARLMAEQHAARPDPPAVGVIYFQRGIIPDIQLGGQGFRVDRDDLLRLTGPAALDTFNGFFVRSTDPGEEKPVPFWGAPGFLREMLYPMWVSLAERASAQGTAFILLSDGAGTGSSLPSGSATGSERLAALPGKLGGVQIHNVSMASDDNTSLGARAARASGGLSLPTPDPKDLPGAFFELGASELGQPLAWHYDSEPRVTSRGTPEFPRNRLNYDVEVETGARTLEFMISPTAGAPGISTRISTQFGDLVFPPWSPSQGEPVLVTPGGTGITLKPGVVSSANAASKITVEADSHFWRVLVESPKVGTWTLAFDEDLGGQAAALVENPEISCNLTLDSSEVSQGGDLHVVGTVIDGLPVSDGVDFDVTLIAPDDSRIAVSLESTGEGTFVGTVPYGSLVGDGHYQAVGKCEASSSAQVVVGESIPGVTTPTDRQLPRPERRFVREPSNAVHVTMGFPAGPPTDGDRAGDCDLDTIPNELEAAGDFDQDGLPDVCDGDADNDEVPDSLDPDPRDPNVPTPATCSAVPSDVGCCSDIWACTGASGYVLYADEGVELKDRSRVGISGGEEKIASRSRTLLGVEAFAPTALSLGNVELRHRSHLESLTSDASLSGEGDVTEVIEARPELPPLSTLSIRFPTWQESVDVQPDQKRELSPGSYGKVSVKSRSTLVLTSGVYYFDSLEAAEPTSEIVYLGSSDRPLYIFVKNGLFFRGKVLHDSAAESVLMGYFGTQDAHVETEFLGTLVAPHAKVVLKASLARGAFFGKQVEVGADVQVKHVPFRFPWLPAGVRRLTGGDDGAFSLQAVRPTTQQGAVESSGGCTVANPAGGVSWSWGLLALAMSGGASWRRRRTRRQSGRSKSEL